MMLRSAGLDAAHVVVREAPSRVLYLVAVAVGALTGVIGIGGGFLLVPALVVFGRETMRAAVGTSLLVIAMNCVSGFAGQRDVSTIPWMFVITFSAVAIAGIRRGHAVRQFRSAALAEEWFRRAAARDRRVGALAEPCEAVTAQARARDVLQAFL